MIHHKWPYNENWPTPQASELGMDPLLGLSEGALIMSKSIGGVYRDGKVELSKMPLDVPEGTRVVVTFPETSYDLRELGIDEVQAADLRARLGAFAEDWESPEMDIYDHYDQSSR